MIFSRLFSSFGVSSTSCLLLSPTLDGSRTGKQVKVIEQWWLGPTCVCVSPNSDTQKFFKLHRGDLPILWIWVSGLGRHRLSPCNTTRLTMVGAVSEEQHRSSFCLTEILEGVFGVYAKSMVWKKSLTVFVSQPKAAWYRSAHFSYWEDRLSPLTERQSGLA